MRIAFIGGFGHHYLKGWFKDSRSHELQAAVAGDGYDNERPKKLLRSAPEGTAWFDDAREMLDRFKPDFVSVGAVYGLNGDWIAETLERRIPTVSDKPIAGTREQLQRIRAEAARSGCPILTEFPFRCLPEFRAVRDVVRQGLLGDVVLATAQKSYKFGGSRPGWFRDRALYTGTLLWVASHGVDAIRFATGEKFVSVTARHGNVAKPDYATMEDHAVAVFALENGGTAMVQADYLRPQTAQSHGDDRIRIAGSKGVVEVRDGRAVLMTHDEAPHDITDTTRRRLIHEELVAALRGESTEFYSTEHSLEIAQTLLLARDAADRSETVSLGG